MPPSQTMIDNLLSGLLGAIIVAAIGAFIQWRFILRRKREEIGMVLRKLRRRVELESLDMNGVFDVFKEYRDRVEDGVHAYACYVLCPDAIRRAIGLYCGYAEDHPYRTVNKMPEDRHEFLERIDALERALDIEDSPTRRPRK